jgi:hypothetical protein
LAWSSIRKEEPIILFEKTAMRLWSQRPLHVKGDPVIPVNRGGGQEKNNQKKCRTKEEEKRKGSLTQNKKNLRVKGQFFDTSSPLGSLWETIAPNWLIIYTWRLWPLFNVHSPYSWTWV